MIEHCCFTCRRLDCVLRFACVERVVISVGSVCVVITFQRVCEVSSIVYPAPINSHHPWSTREVTPVGPARIRSGRGQVIQGLSGSEGRDLWISVNVALTGAKD